MFLFLSPIFCKIVHALSIILWKIYVHFHLLQTDLYIQKHARIFTADKVLKPNNCVHPLSLSIWPYIDMTISQCTSTISCIYRPLLPYHVDLYSLLLSSDPFFVLPYFFCNSTQSLAEFPLGLLKLIELKSPGLTLLQMISLVKIVPLSDWVMMRVNPPGLESVLCFFFVFVFSWQTQ